MIISFSPPYHSSHCCSCCCCFAALACVLIAVLGPFPTTPQHNTTQHSKAEPSTLDWSQGKFIKSPPCTSYQTNTHRRRGEERPSRKRDEMRADRRRGEEQELNIQERRRERQSTQWQQTSSRQTTPGPDLGHISHRKELELAARHANISCMVKKLHLPKSKCTAIQSRVTGGENNAVQISCLINMALNRHYVTQFYLASSSSSESTVRSESANRQHGN